LIVPPLPRSLRDRASSLLGGIVGVLLAGLVTLTLAQVVLRYAFAASLVWVEEASVIALIWMTWIGAAKLWLDRRHIEVDLFTKSLSASRRRALNAVCDVLMILFGVLLCWFASKTITVNTGLELAGLKMDSAEKYRPVLIGAALLALAAFITLFSDRPDDTVNRDVD
jgi:TRAP-type transport system small permease protein